MMQTTHAEGFYLDGRHFSAMIAVACLVHMTILLGYMLMPKSTVTKIPVHVLNVKLGSGDATGDGGNSGGRRADVASVQAQRSAVVVPQQRETPPAAPVEVAAAPEPENVEVKTPVAETGEVPAPVAPPKAKPEKARVASRYAPAAPYTPSGPSQYVRAGAGDGSGESYGVAGGVSYGNSVSADAVVMQRYTQQISLWVQRQRPLFFQGVQPGMKGNIIVRLQIDRAGNILHFRLDKATGVPAADAAAGEMVRASNPVPPVPRDYPSGNVFEFLVSVNYNKPS